MLSAITQIPLRKDSLIDDGGDEHGEAWPEGKDDDWSDPVGGGEREIYDGKAGKSAMQVEDK